MAQIRHLERAPIVEALIDVRVETPDGFDAAQLSALTERLKSRFPESQERRRFKAQLTIGDALPVSDLSNSLAGFVSKSADGFDVAQFSDDGFTLSRLKPYEDWHRLRECATGLWADYTEIIGVSKVTRLATRYINRLDVPSPVEFSDYLTAPPEVPSELPQTVTDFQTRMAFHMPDDGANVILTQGLRPAETPGDLGILIDVDVFKAVELTTEDDIWSTIDGLRDVKNRVFFGSITEKSAELYE